MLHGVINTTVNIINTTLYFKGEIIYLAVVQAFFGMVFHEVT